MSDMVIVLLIVVCIGAPAACTYGVQHEVSACAIALKDRPAAEVERLCRVQR